jgi:hypothetical protein
MLTRELQRARRPTFVGPATLESIVSNMPRRLNLPGSVGRCTYHCRSATIALLTSYVASEEVPFRICFDAATFLQANARCGVILHNSVGLQKIYHFIPHYSTETHMLLRVTTQ